MSFSQRNVLRWVPMIFYNDVPSVLWVTSLQLQPAPHHANKHKNDVFLLQSLRWSARRLKPTWRPWTPPVRSTATPTAPPRRPSRGTKTASRWGSRCGGGRSARGRCRSPSCGRATPGATPAPPPTQPASPATRWASPYRVGSTRYRARNRIWSLRWCSCFRSQQ